MINYPTEDKSSFDDDELRVTKMVLDSWKPGEVFRTLELAERLNEDPTSVQWKLRAVKNKEILGVVICRVAGSQGRNYWFYRF
ncbi:MAG TPA: hypothetical protein VHK86_01605 [Nitrososphaera sp.]|nr:hypothetical protein [Nitrososphaera sp.]